MKEFFLNATIVVGGIIFFATVIVPGVAQIYKAFKEIFSDLSRGFRLFSEGHTR